MTRINIVPPTELTDQHLVAEYREIFMVGPSLQRSIKSKAGVHGIPNRYTLNKGHVKFFYNKGKYLHNRYLSLIAEMRDRGMNPNPDRVFSVDHFPDPYYNDWCPEDGDFDIVRDRIRLRISERPGWYKRNGKKIEKV